MRPEHNRALSQSTGIARAKMYLKQDLAWLAGFPIAQSDGRVEWMLRPRVGHSANATITIDRERLSQAQFTLTKLVGRFPKAMPKLVGNVAVWEQRVTRLLNAVKSAVHHGAAIVGCHDVPLEVSSDHEAQAACDVVRQWPALKRCVEAVLWSTLVDDEVRAGFINWLAANAHWLTRMLEAMLGDTGTRTVLLLADLARADGAESLKCLRPILGEPLSFLLPTHGFFEYVTQTAHIIKRNKDRDHWPVLPSRPSPTIAAATLDFLKWLEPQATPLRRCAVELLNETLATDRIVEWATKWDEFDQRVGRELRRIQNLPANAWHIKYRVEAKQLGEALELSNESLGPGVSATLVFDCVRTLALDERRSRVEPLLRCLRLLPEMNSTIPISLQGNSQFRCEHLRCALLCEMKRTAKWAGDFQWTSAFVSALERFLRDAAGDEISLIPWMRSCPIHRVLERPTWYQSPWLQILSADENSKLLPNCMAVMLKLKREVAESETCVERIQQLVLATGDADLSAKYLRELQDRDLLEFSELSFIKLAAQLATNEVSFVALIRAFHKVADQLWEWRGHAEHVLEMATYFRQLGQLNLVSRLIARGQVKEVFDAAHLLAVAKKVGLGRAANSSSSGDSPMPSWAEWYPEPLRSLVVELAGVDGVGVRAVDNLIGQWWPSRAKLEHEIDSIALRLTGEPTNSHLTLRLERLRQRLDCPQPLSPTRIARLEEELIAAIERRQFETTVWVTKCELAWELFGRPCGITSDERDRYPQFIDGVLSSKPYLELINGVVRLKSPYRELAIRLLNRSWREVPWDLAAEPPNRAFLEKMRQRGLRMDAWLNDAKQSIVKSKEGKEFSLQFETDSAETLLMGYHFDTCLSPHGFNFFSAVVNAVDINKRVLFARDHKGQVVARCLFAIGDGGTIVVFRAYCHDSALEFDRHVARIAQLLADELGTVVSRSDRVSPLMTPDWYDDGAVDYDVTIDGQASSLRQVVKTIAPDDFIELLEQAFGPALSMGTRISITVGLDEFKARPDLLRPLLPVLKQHETSLPIDTHLTIASCADLGGQRELAARILERYAFDWLVKRPCLCCWPQRDHMQLLVKHRPSIALRVIRQTRRQRVRSDEEEFDEGRREWLAEIHESLGRAQLASRLRQR